MCSHCKTYGHGKEDCRKKPAELKTKDSKELEPRTNAVTGKEVNARKQGAGGEPAIISKHNTGVQHSQFHVLAYADDAESSNREEAKENEIQKDISAVPDPAYA
ncbi:OLC1v1023127C1 [Oldenlandia corymbosa var. corymbosa]|uniref:OLC1v1023127C1 n=1 Tax=Oldenlandia corymbosa var. corymbosa TaxID=529605 RepID=A0AAV1C4T1_OLDCO|nr:OLC1v1023127C1 [Oldenlandia corymbosa var. corymbosa]